MADLETSLLPNSKDSLPGSFSYSLNALSESINYTAWITSLTQERQIRRGLWAGVH